MYMKRWSLCLTFSLSLIVFRLMSMISFMLQERVKRIQGLFILCLTPHHHLTHAMRNKNKEKAKTLRKDDDNVDKKFFLIFTILYLSFNATNAAVIKKSHVSWKLKKAVKEIKQNFRFHLQFYNKFIFTTCSFIEFHHHIMIGCLHALCVYVCMEVMFYI